MLFRSPAAGIQPQAAACLHGAASPFGVAANPTADHTSPIGTAQGGPPVGPLLSHPHLGPSRRTLDTQVPILAHQDHTQGHPDHIMDRRDHTLEDHQDHTLEDHRDHTLEDHQGHILEDQLHRTLKLQPLH